MLKTVVVTAFVSAMSLTTHVFAADGALRSVKSGVYSEAQAKRGEDLIYLECAKCHSATLLGGENNSPPLVGKVFLDKWKGKPLAELFTKMVTTMPSDDPGRLSKSEFADLLAYILSVNKFPAGTTDLPNTPEGLATISIEQ